MKTFIFLLSFAFSAFACEEKATRYILNKMPKSQKEEICFSAKLDMANSKECSPVSNPKCWFSKIDKKKKISDYIGPRGSPGFNLCHALKGSPQIYEIELKPNVWRSYSRCFSPNKKHFVDISTLIPLYK